MLVWLFSCAAEISECRAKGAAFHLEVNPAAEMTSFPTPAVVPPSDKFVRQCELIDIIDGDTFRVRVDLGWRTTVVDELRPYRVNTPEVRGSETLAGKFVEKLVREWIGNEKRLTIRSEVFESGKYGRCLCEIWVADRCLNDWLLDEGLAWPTDEHGALVGKRDIDRLFGIPATIRNHIKGISP